ncbi:NAD(P)-dependent oxidoreductase, partial [Bacillus sp. SIMBA_026]|uniref:NAD(P)-dependent oxidoreductase n=1 Tax=Bacillus sp. SIMBA_026 TaxID=3085769 RepID=UPI00397BDE09
FGMRVIYHNRSRLAPGIESECRASYVDKDTLLRESDHLIIVVPYSESSHHAIGAAQLKQMKSTATLTKIARGGLVDDDALAV